jgi:hypothetical protein
MNLISVNIPLDSGQTAARWMRSSALLGAPRNKRNFSGSSKAMFVLTLITHVDAPLKTQVLEMPINQFPELLNGGRPIGK